MTQFFNKSGAGSEKQRVLSDSSTNSGRNGSASSNFPAKVKSFFRIQSLGSNTSLSSTDAAPATSRSEGVPHTIGKFRGSRFLGGKTRNRSVTAASEGNVLDESVSPTMHANPYFAYQGPPALRHYNPNSVPPSPPDYPSKIRPDGTSGANDQATAANKEELARKLRRVASAPNAQGLFSNTSKNSRPQTADMMNGSLGANDDDESEMMDSTDLHLDLLPIPGSNGIPSPGQIRQNAQFRRTYSSNSIKVRNVEVGPSSFDKIKLIGKGDVGKVYLVREKKSNRLYAMKGNYTILSLLNVSNLSPSSKQERNDQAQ